MNNTLNERLKRKMDAMLNISGMLTADIPMYAVDDENDKYDLMVALHYLEDAVRELDYVLGADMHWDDYSAYEFYRVDPEMYQYPCDRIDAIIGLVQGIMDDIQLLPRAKKTAALEWVSEVDCIAQETKALMRAVMR